MDRLSRLHTYGPMLVRAFVGHKLPGVWGLALARQESDFTPSAASTTGGDERRGGSFGLCQVSLKTAQEFVPNITVEDLLDPKTNAEMAALVCVRLSKQFNGNLADVASAYNSGKSLAHAPESTRKTYVPHVLQFADDYADCAANMGA